MDSGRPENFSRTSPDRLQAPLVGFLDGEYIRKEEDMTHEEGTAPLPKERGSRLLGIWAHPDDEAYLSAGLMARTIDAGGTVTLVTITDGELGFAADDPTPLPTRARQRRGELRNAMTMIGVQDIRFCGVPDGGLAAVPRRPLVEHLATIIEEVQPDTIVTFGPDGITGHDDHIANCGIATQAWLAAGIGELWYAAKTDTWLTEWRELHDDFGIWMTEEPTGVPEGQVDLLVNLQGSELAKKRAVLAAHRSQTEAVAQLFGEERYCRWISEETFRRPTDTEIATLDPTRFLAVA